ncbi:MAG: sulfatase-like hydrolase/transferase [Verrucomicrobiales bacterium]|nr:sulfatase-like hydrolase/transferase [Verrucomicrobiales bacterium]
MKFCLLSLAVLVSLLSVEAASPPNFVVILADDLGRGDYSAFGTPDIRTPHMDRLFKEGTAMDNFFANCPVCSPSRAALLTGRYPDRVGVPGVIRDRAENSWGNLADDAVLLPKLLQGAGYHSAIVGKWHLGLKSPDTPLDRGFDHFHGFLGDMMDDYWTHLRNGHNFMRRDREVIDPKGHATDLFTEWACDYLKQRAEPARQGQPFFLYLAYNAPHDPIQPPPEWLEKVRAREPGMSEVRSKLVALIEHLDAGIGQVLDTLDETGLTENTVVIFTSDNGGVLNYEANNGPYRSGKQHMYDGGLRVAFAARWPGQIEPGSHCAASALTMDIAATLCDIADVKTPETMNGVSLRGVLTGKEKSLPERDHYFIRREGGAAYFGLTIEALRRGDWKLVHDLPTQALELYHVSEDPLEEHEASKKAPKIFNEMRAALQAEIQRAGSVPWQ